MGQSELRLPAPTTVGKGGPERAQHSTCHPVGLGIDCLAPPQALASPGLPPPSPPPASEAWKVYGGRGHLEAVGARRGRGFRDRKGGARPLGQGFPRPGPEVLPAIYPESLPRGNLLALPCPSTPAPTPSRGTQPSVLQWPVLLKLSSIQANLPPPNTAPSCLLPVDSLQASPLVVKDPHDVPTHPPTPGTQTPPSPPTPALMLSERETLQLRSPGLQGCQAWSALPSTSRREGIPTCSSSTGPTGAPTSSRGLCGPLLHRRVSFL